MSGPDPERALEQYRREAPIYDRRAVRSRIVRRLQRAAVNRLDLTPAQIVADLACGTGLNFEQIVDAIGPDGRLIGVDLSPAMLAVARRRVADAGWSNVDLVEAPAEEVSLSPAPNAVLFSLTHDVLQSDRAIDNVVGQLAPGARVVAMGPKWAPRWRVPVNIGVWAAARRYVTTFEGLDRPWACLERAVPGLIVRPALFGGLYFAWGRTPRDSDEEDVSR